MYIYFQDWTTDLFLRSIESRGLPHGGKIIKIFASSELPNTRYQKPNLTAVESDGSLFLPTEVFTYEGGRTFTGDQLETMLAERDLNDKGKEVVRALYRFENQEDTAFCQASMSTRDQDHNFIFNDPFAGIDGMNRAVLGGNPEDHIHLDIFYPESLERLKTIVDYSDSERVIGIRDVMRIRREQQITQSTTERI